VLQNGRDIQPADARAGTESVGPLAGDEIEAEFALPQGVVARFTSRGRLRAREGTWYLELVGSRRRARLLLGFDPPVYVCENTAWTETGRTEQWQRWPDDPGLREPPGQQAGANRRVVLDWLAAIREGRDPVCNGLAALQALEMVVAVYRAALEGRRVPLPLTERRHPLGGDA
jgi:predicted dehydrogenase